MQERRNSIANALELRLFCTNPSACHRYHDLFCDEIYGTCLLIPEHVRRLLSNEYHTKACYILLAFSLSFVILTVLWGNSKQLTRPFWYQHYFLWVHKVQSHGMDYFACQMQSFVFKSETGSKDLLNSHENKLLELWSGLNLKLWYHNDNDIYTVEFTSRIG